MYDTSPEDLKLLTVRIQYSLLEVNNWKVVIVIVFG